MADDFALAERTKNKISAMKGTELRLVGRLTLKFLRDICNPFLMLPHTILINLILSPSEVSKLTNIGDKLEVKLLEPNGKITSSINLVKKDNLAFVFGFQNEWQTVVARNRFRVGFPVDLWSFVDGEKNRCFAMEFGNNEGGGSGGANGSGGHGGSGSGGGSTTTTEDDDDSTTSSGDTDTK